MTTTQFITKLKTYIGKVVDYDHVLGYQCTDFVKEGLTIATGRRFGAMGNASTWWTNPDSELRVVATKLTGSNVLPGDVVVKRPNHVGIATGGMTITSVEIIEQNGHTGNGKGQGQDRIRTRWISRSDVFGLWRINALHTTDAPSTPAVNGMVGKIVHLSARVSSWRVYNPGTRVVRATLNPAKYGGLSYIIKGIDSLPNRVLIDSSMFGRVSCPIDADATIN